MCKIIPKLTIYTLTGDIVYMSIKYNETIKKLISIGITMDNVLLNKSPMWLDGNKDIIQMLKEEYSFTHVDITYKHSKYFAKEHYHDDMELRLFCAGSGTFYINLENHIAKLVCNEGDYLLVPANIKHWFHSDGFVAIRFFTTHKTWSANYTNSDLPELFKRRHLEA